MTGKDLKNKLELTGIPFRQIAEALNISEQNLQNKMSSADIKVSFLCKTSKKLHKSIYYFLELGKLKAQHSQSQNKESECHSIVDKITEAFTSESSGDYGVGSLLTKQPITSKRSSAGKT